MVKKMLNICKQDAQQHAQTDTEHRCELTTHAAAPVALIKYTLMLNQVEKAATHVELIKVDKTRCKLGDRKLRTDEAHLQGNTIQTMLGFAA